MSKNRGLRGHVSFGGGCEEEEWKQVLKVGGSRFLKNLFFGCDHAYAYISEDSKNSLFFFPQLSNTARKTGWDLLGHGPSNSTVVPWECHCARSIHKSSCYLNQHSSSNIHCCFHFVILVLCWPLPFLLSHRLHPFYFLFGTHVVFVLQCFSSYLKKIKLILFSIFL